MTFPSHLHIYMYIYICIYAGEGCKSKIRKWKDRVPNSKLATFKTKIIQRDIEPERYIFKGE